MERASPLRRLLSRERRAEILRYLVVGAANFVATFMVFYALNRIVRLDHHLALALTWVFAVAFNYVMQLGWVFRARDTPRVDRSFVEFAAVYVLGYAFNATLIYVAVDIFRLDVVLSQALITPAIVCFNYLAVRFIVLRPSVVRRMAAERRPDEPLP